MKEILVKTTFEKGYFCDEKNLRIFILTIRNSINRACKICDEKYKTEGMIKSFEKLVSSYSTYADKVEKLSQESYKSEKRREEFKKNRLRSYIEESVKYVLSGTYYDKITFFDFDVNPGINGISSECILEVDNLTDEAITKCWEKIKDNKYFQNATGFAFEYKPYSRNQIKLILPKNIQKEWDKDYYSLSNAIEKFYSTSKYCGD